MKNDRVYPIDIYVDTGKNCITGTQCTCRAGRGPTGSCKHIAAACFALEDFVRLRSRILSLEDNDQVSCTSLLQQWNKPRKHRLDRLKNGWRHQLHKQNIWSRTKKVSTRAIWPLPSISKENNQFWFKRVLTSHQLLVALHLLSKPGDAVAKSTQAALSLLPCSVKTWVTSTLLKSSLPPPWQFLQEVGNDFIAGITPTKEQQDLIEIKTPSS